MLWSPHGAIETRYGSASSPVAMRIGSPYTRDPWKPNTGKRWAPDVLDRHRAMPSDVDGLIDR